MSERPVIEKIEVSGVLVPAVPEAALPTILAEMGFDVTTAIVNGRCVHTYSFPMAGTNETVSPAWQWAQEPNPQDD